MVAGQRQLRQLAGRRGQRHVDRHPDQHRQRTDAHLNGGHHRPRQPGDFGINSTLCGGATLAPNGSCNTTVHFAPTATGNRTASLEFTDDASNSPQDVPLSGFGLPATAPIFSVSPASLTFPNQQVGTTSATKTLAITNTGSAFLHFSSIVFGGGAAADYGMPTNDCGGAGGIAPGATCHVGVDFTPGAIALVTPTSSSPTTPQAPRRPSACSVRASRPTRRASAPAPTACSSRTPPSAPTRRPRR